MFYICHRLPACRALFRCALCVFARALYRKVMLQSTATLGGKQANGQILSSFYFVALFFLRFIFFFACSLHTRTAWPLGLSLLVCAKKKKQEPLDRYATPIRRHRPDPYRTNLTPSGCAASRVRPLSRNRSGVC